MPNMLQQPMAAGSARVGGSAVGKDTKAIDIGSREEHWAIMVLGI